MRSFFSILGGMGTIATESYVRLINHRVKISRDQDYLNYILVNHATVPDRTSYILNPSEHESFLPYLIEDIEQQNKLGPDFIVMVCNTAHYFYEELQKNSQAPILHMPRIAIKQMVSQYPTEEKIGLIATRGTIADGIYKNEIEKVGKEVVLGGPEIQELVDELIYQNIKEKGIVDVALYHQILQKMHDDYGVNVIVLGCTELSLAQEKGSNHQYQVIDAQSIIADVTIDLATRIRKGQDKQSLINHYQKA
ncbi:amino acid racemase [Holzapfeliella sp. He02]|uniref:Amino acid racemase n=1 Tax=Holzapfeliella saturejae TaxID=3082953 RepID=A0ABU8SFH6_9LACO